MAPTLTMIVTTPSPVPPTPTLPVAGTADAPKAVQATQSAPAASASSAPPVPAPATVLGTVTFQVRAETSFGDRLVLVGSGSALGDWDAQGRGLPLTTTPEDYPLWTTGPVTCPVPSTGSPVEYKYVRLHADGGVEWEFDGSNRQLPLRLGQDLRVQWPAEPAATLDDGHFGQLPAEPFAVCKGRLPSAFQIQPASGNLRLVVAGDSVAAGWGAWQLEGWAVRLGRSLNQRFGYGYANVAEVGHDAYKTQQVFQERVAPLKPSVVLIAISSELQRLASCPVWERGDISAYYLRVVQDLASASWELGALPVVCGRYPHANYGEEHQQCLREVDDAVRRLGLPVLEWLSAVVAPGDAQSWAPGVNHSIALPNTRGHELLASAVDLGLFSPDKIRATLAKRADALQRDQLCFKDKDGFEVKFSASSSELIVINTTSNSYKLGPGWAALQQGMEAARREAPWALRRGLWLAADSRPLPPGSPAAVAIGPSGGVAAEVEVPAGCTVTFKHSSVVVRPGTSQSKVLFYDTKVGVLCTPEGVVRIFNETDCEYNVHPMWQEFRLATRVLPMGVYEDGSGAPFRTAVVTAHGLQSRVKVPPRFALDFRYVGPLSSLEQVAVLPLGDRCSIRMLLHKIEYDGPCYPFDLTRSTSLADVADMVGTGFSDMWNGDLLEYNHEAGRIFHRKWQGLSYAHEVEEGDDPVGSFWPIVERMAKRYGGRAARFDYACKNAKKVLFVRTGCASRGEVCNLLERIRHRYPAINCSLLIISDQDTGEFSGLQGVSHVRESFDPDRMYEEPSYWMHCAHRFRGILDGHGINARSLYWCPNNLKEAEKELAEAAARDAAGNLPAASPLPARTKSEAPALQRGFANFSHSNLYKLESAAPSAAAGEDIDRPAKNVVEAK